MDMKQKLKENEAYFRGFNEKLTHELHSLSSMAQREGHNDLVPDEQQPIHFHCECSDEACSMRVRLNIREYRRLHKQRDRFVIRPGHETTRVEKVVARHPDYYVVEKFETPPEQPATLHRTHPIRSKRKD
jgi:hypothetical protein